PFFMLAGYFMMTGGVSRRIFDFADSLVGWLPGGMGIVNVVSSMIFGGMSGSSVADTAGLGPIELEAMTKYKYPLNYSAAITVSSSCLSVVIPPSVLLVMYGVMAGTSVGAMLLAGVLPGLLISLALIVVNVIYCKRNRWGYSEVKELNLRRLWTKTRESFWALLTPLVLLGGILSGLVTPTEASAIAVLYTLILGLFVYKELSLRDLPGILVRTGKTAGVALIVVGMSSMATFLLTAERVPDTIAMAISGLHLPPFVVMLSIVLFLLMVGMFINAVVSITVLVPILLPIATALGYDPVHFGVIMVATLAIGLITPPVGSCLFVVSSISGLSIEEVTRSLLPFYVALILTMTVLVLFPQISLGLPKIVLGG
ncbi:MAG: TRAP transporter large permease, partial [Bacillota bacterium]